MPSAKPTLYLLLAVALYAVAHLTWYLDTPLGQAPVLDGRENLLLAEQIADGTLTREPFFRAMLYPWLLSVLPLHWAVIGLVCHLANAWLAIRIAARFWNHATGALIAGGLVGFNPTLLHFAFDPLDITVATTFFLLSLLLLQKAKLRQSLYSANIGCAAAAGASLALAALARPHFMAVLLPAAALLIVAGLRRRVTLSNALAFAGSAALPLCVYGLAQLSWSGAFGVMPWQGAYNLWVSNKPGANGLYYQQSLEFHYTGEHRNANRLEAEELYRRATGSDGDIAATTAYWRSQTLKHILRHPLDWSLLMGFKTYAALNNFEQYNNKTFSFHKRLSPWLRYNPISWGLLLTGAVFACSTLWRQIRPDLVPLLILLGCYAGGMLLYMVSARFRLPLVPPLAILCGGLPYAIEAIKVSSRASRRRALIATGATAAIAFSAFGSVNARGTYLQDMLLMADAAAQSGRDREAITWATAALQLEPEKQSAHRVILLSRYNLAASGEIAPDHAFWTEQESALRHLQIEDERIAFVRGLALWNIGNANQAIAIWKSAYERYGLAASPCLAAIALVAPAAEPIALTDGLLAELATGSHPILACALALRTPASERDAFLQTINLAPDQFQAIAASLSRVLPIQ